MHAARARRLRGGDGGLERRATAIPHDDGARNGPRDGAIRG